MINDNNRRFHAIIPRQTRLYVIEGLTAAQYDPPNITLSNLSNNLLRNEQTWGWGMAQGHMKLPWSHKVLDAGVMRG